MQAHKSGGSGLVSSVAARVPEPVFVRLLSLAYLRFEPELRRLDDFCPSGGTALDVGAWYGPWTRALSSRVDRVVAFEPNPTVAAVLRRTAPDNATVVEAAAGAGDSGATSLWVPDRGIGSEGVASTVHHEAGDVAVEVPTTTVDAVVGDPVRGIDRVGLVKIDVEGAEQAVLEGATETLAAHRPVLLVELEYHRSDVATTLRHLDRLGYDGSVLLDGKWAPLTGFDLRAHQERVRPQLAERGFLGRVLRPGDAYVNNVLFRPRSED